MVESDDDTFTGILDTFTHEEDGDIDSGSVAGTVYTGSHVSTQHAPREAPALTPHVNKHMAHGGDVFANDGFEIRGWDETGLHVGSARRFGGSIGTLVTKDADMARKPAEVNVEARCFE